MYDVVYQCTKA